MGRPLRDLGLLLLREAGPHSYALPCGRSHACSVVLRIPEGEEKRQHHEESSLGYASVSVMEIFRQLTGPLIHFEDRTTRSKMNVAAK